MNGQAQIPSAWQIERERFRKLFHEWLEARSSKFFDLSIHGPADRRFRILALGAGFIAFGFIVHILLYVFPVLAPPPAVSLQSFLAPSFIIVFQLLLILLIPASIAINMAGNYLADVFELKDARSAWKFISELSLGGANEVLHIRDGKIAEASQDSPIMLIGGPGRVLVEFDSAALFEKTDGTPHVIGPASLYADKLILDGFERLREPIINLRDQYIGNPSAEPMTIVSRSLDGIPVSAIDVRAVFSIRRDVKDSEPTIESPYPFDPRSVEDLIYRQAVPVLIEGPHPSGLPSHWTNAMQGLVRGAISEFMSQHKLAEYLSSIGKPEIEASEHQEDAILRETLQYSSEPPSDTPSSAQPPRFHPRTELSELFRRYTAGFSRRARERGVELHWIGPGTWKIPDQIANDAISNRHLEAWRLNRENMARSDPSAFEQVKDESYLNEKLRLIQNVPFAAHQKNQEMYSEKKKRVEALLQSYLEQMGDALDVYYKNQARSAEVDQIEEAVLAIEQLLNISGGSHTVGGASLSRVRPRPFSHNDESVPPAPSSEAEAEQYRILLTKLDGNYKLIERMLASEAGRHPGLPRIELIERINTRMERYGR